MQKHYKVLGVPRGASEGEINKAFRKLSLAVHPDKGGDVSRMVELNDARRALLNQTVSDDKQWDEWDEGEDGGVTGICDILQLACSGIRLSQVFADKYLSLVQDFKKGKVRIIDKWGALVISAAHEALEGEQAWYDHLFRFNETPRRSAASPVQPYVAAALKEAFYAPDAVALARVLLVGTPEVIDTFIKQQTTCGAVDTYPSLLHRALLLLCRAQLRLHSGAAFEAREDMQAAVLASPTDGVLGAVCLLSSQPCVQVSAFREMFEGVRQLALLHTDEFAEPPEVLIPALKPACKQEPSHFKKLVPNSFLKTISKCEAGIRSTWGHSLSTSADKREAAMRYVDLVAVARDHSESAVCLLIASMWLYDAMHSSEDEAERYSLASIINEIALNSFFVSQKTSPPVQLALFRFQLSVVYHANYFFSKATKRRQSAHGPGAEGREFPARSTQLILPTVFGKLLHLSKAFPLVTLSCTPCSDVTFVEVVACMQFDRFLEHAAASVPNPQFAIARTPFLNPFYYLLDGSWGGWRSREKFDADRLECMKSLLLEKNWVFEDVEKLLMWRVVPRTDLGWLQASPAPLNLGDGVSFCSVDGFCFNNETGEVNLLLSSEEDSTYDLFTWGDVVDVLQKGIPGAVFTLDQPSVNMDSHPFQEARYGPASLHNTDYLMTMLHADYLLKMMTTGTEVCGFAPFRLRPAEEGFMGRLPEDLRHKLRPIASRKNGSSIGDAHRFWIEAGEVPFTVTEEGDNVIHAYGPVRMVVKKHLLRRNEAGELVDACEDTNDKSPEAKFAKAFTENYDLVGVYFPELLRLRELYKLSAIAAQIRGIYKGLKKSLKTMKPDGTAVVRILKDIKQKVNYPLATNSAEIEKHKRHVLSKNDISWSDRHRVPAHQMKELEDNIVRQLREADDSSIQQIADIFHVRRSQVERPLAKWLPSSSRQSLWFTLALEREPIEPPEDLVSVLADGMMQHRKEKVRALLLPLQKHRLHSPKTSLVTDIHTTSCVWVPASFCGQSSSSSSRERAVRVYGGVSLAVRTNRVTPNSTNQSWSTARQQFWKQCLHDINTPRHIRGWVQNEMRHISFGNRSTIRNPKGYDVGHRLARCLGGDNSQANLRVEYTADNRARGPKERALAAKRHSRMVGIK